MSHIGCGFFGCLRPVGQYETVDIVVNGDPLTISACAYHQDIINNGDPTKYHLAYSYTGEPEIRLHALPDPAPKPPPA